MMEFRALRVPALTQQVAMDLEVALDSLPGIEQFTIALDTQELHIVFDESLLGFQKLALNMAEVGCPLHHINAALLFRERQPEKVCYKAISG